MAQSYYKRKYDRRFSPGRELPIISTDLDSVRAFQFEIHFYGLPPDITNVPDLTLAAKRVSGLGAKNEPIVIDRVNDKLHYPGKTTMEELTVDFDNLYLRETASDLWRYFKSIYDPISGEMTKYAQPGGIRGQTFKVNKVEIIKLDNTMEPHSVTQLFGVYPTSYTESEFNYSTNSFHHIAVNFKYDFMNIFDYSNPR